MMEKLRNPKNAKTISLVIAAIFVIGCFTIALTAGGFSNLGGVASAAGSDSAIGVVNYQVLVSQSPKLNEVREAMQKEVEATRKEFEDKSKNMNTEEKDRYYQQLQQRLGNKQNELMDPLLKQINDTIQKIAQKKGLSVVVDKSSVIYGGADITDEVAKALQGAAK